MSTDAPGNDLVWETIQFLTPEEVLMRGGIVWNDTWESVKFPEGYEKPQKEEFETKLQELVDAQPLKDLRKERNKRLTECDWVTLKAYSTQKVVPKVWRDYMQALRDLPSTTEDPSNPVWPSIPNA